MLVEIAPGYGRWTHFLREYCDELIGVDLSARCVKACRRRFRWKRSLSFHVTDGKSIAGVDDGTADFVFSFDSLVHVEQDVMDAYLGELARVLDENGVAFLHHSNMAAYTPEEVGPRMPHWRADSVSAEGVAATAAGCGLSCFKQELITWGDDHEFLSDSFTWITRTGSDRDRPAPVLTNTRFMDEPRQGAVGHVSA
jgi:cyclopropane fatty-acyl-phospholipid synthase-like methyltransferase